MLARLVGRAGVGQRLRFVRWQHSTANRPERVAQDVLAAYPIFNLNEGDGGQHGTPLGPRPGDEAILTLSGGVDSSVASYLAISSGALVPKRTIFMRNWNSLEESQGFEPGAGGAHGCQWMRDWERVQDMARWLDVKPELVDLSQSYWNTVFAPSLDDWQRGLTPNPDVLCNREIKFGELLRRLDAEEETASTSFGRRITRQWLVTGHYAHIEYFHPCSDANRLHGKLLRAIDPSKDQSYFLSGVSSLQFGRSHFPLANLQKHNVRQTARALGMPTSESEESMGLCFVGKRNRRLAEPKAETTRQHRGYGPPPTQLGFAGFLDDYIDASAGPIETPDGQQLGMHSGLHTMTIGQGAKVGGAKHRYFVAAKDTQKNRIIVVPGIDHPMLQCASLEMNTFHSVCPDAQPIDLSGTLYAQIRHRQDPVPCRAILQPDNGQNASQTHVRVHFDSPVTSVAEGQVCALYKGRQCLGSGVITAVETSESAATSSS